MIPLIVFGITLNIEMDSKAINIANLTNLTGSPLVENNYLSLNTAEKCEPNTKVDEEKELEGGGTNEMQTTNAEVPLCNDIPKIKKEKQDELWEINDGSLITKVKCEQSTKGDEEENPEGDERNDEISCDNAISKIKKEKWDEPVDIPSGLSKRQRKKYIRKVLWETKWKPLKRAKEKERLKQKKLQARIDNVTLGPSRKKLKHCTMASSDCKLRIALDFSFDNLMSEKDLGKCLKQLNHCYCLNRRATNPLQLFVTNFCGAARDQLARGVAYKNWDMIFHEENHLNVFKKEELVYLTSDSNNTITQLDHSKVYIIGALVDHNKYKGKSLEVANDQGINHAQLPISDNLQMNSRKVLTIDHVFEILIHASEGVSWKDSFLKVIPQRKGAKEKSKTTFVQ